MRNTYCLKTSIECNGVAFFLLNLPGHVHLPASNTEMYAEAETDINAKYGTQNDRYTSKLAL